MRLLDKINTHIEDNKPISTFKEIKYLSYLHTHADMSIPNVPPEQE